MGYSRGEQTLRNHTTGTGTTPNPEFKEEKKMTYREMLEGQGYAVNEWNLFILGNWLGNEGARAQTNPDAEPLEELSWEWEAELLEACGEELEEVEEEEEDAVSIP